MHQSISLSKGRTELLAIASELEKHPEDGAITMTRHGKPVLAVLSAELYEGLIDTLELMSDPKGQALLRASLKEAEEGNLISWNTAKKKLGL